MAQADVGDVQNPYLKSWIRPMPVCKTGMKNSSPLNLKAVQFMFP